MPAALVNLTYTEIAIVAIMGLVVLALPFVAVWISLRVFNEFETNRRSDVVDQALTRDEDITPLPPADEPAGKPRI
jgi:hypothetical protein